MKFLFLVNLIFSSLFALNVANANQTYRADIFELGSNRQKKIYTLQAQVEENGESIKSVLQYLDLEGKVVFEEKAEIKGLQIVKDEISQKQTGATAVVEFDGKKAKFSKTENGKTKDDSENVKNDFVMSPNFQRYIKSKWSDLVAGKTIEYRYGVWDRLESVGFKVTKTTESGEGDNKTISLIKKPSSFIIAALVNPIEFTFNADGSRLLSMKGRIPVKQKSGNSWKDLDAEVVYQ